MGNEERKDEALVIKCPFCEGTEIIEAMQSGYGAISSVNSVMRGGAIYHLICRDCGTVVRSFIKDPEKLVKRKERRGKDTYFTKNINDFQAIAVFTATLPRKNTYLGFELKEASNVISAAEPIFKYRTARLKQI